MPRVDPYRNFNFVVEIGGITQAGFSDCSGFGATTAVVEQRLGIDAPHVGKLPGMTTYNNITLKWGLTDSRELWDWYQDIINGKIVRRSGSIIVRDTDAVTERVRWNFFDAWPTKWDGPDFTAKGTDIAIETLELVVERIERG